MPLEGLLMLLKKGLRMPLQGLRMLPGEFRMSLDGLRTLPGVLKTPQD